MEFPITELPDNDACEEWIITHFHPTGFRCPKCRAERGQAHPSRKIFEQRHLTLRQVVLLIRGFVKGEPSTTLAAELAIPLQHGAGVAA